MIVGLRQYRVRCSTKILLETDDADQARLAMERAATDGRYRNLVMDGWNSLAGVYVVIASVGEPIGARVGLPADEN